MIQKIDHHLHNEAEQIRAVFQVSYAVEAKLLSATDFPPLKRPLEKFIDSKNTFYGFYEDNKIAGVIEIKKEHEIIHIQSLVVDPNYFRRGIARQLLNFVFDNHNTKLFTVETGAANKPAITLYERQGFTKIKQWMTDFGIEKVAFEKPMR